jgi:hypothetical protein
MDRVEQLKFKSGSGVSGYGVQVGPYSAQLTSYAGSPLVTVYCVDFLHGISVNQEWSANVSKLNLSQIGSTRLGIAGDDGDALARYRKGAWLASQFASAPTTSWKQIHSAIWTTVIAGNDPTKSYYNKYGDWLSQANAAEASGYAGFDFSRWAVLTDVRADDLGAVDVTLQPGVQEYLVQLTVTPEPETFVMLLSGLLVLAVLWRRGGFA